MATKEKKPHREDMIPAPPLPAKPPKPLEVFLEAVGKDELLLALEQSDKVPLIEVAKSLCDPAVTILGACKKHKVTLMDLVSCFQEFKHAEGIIRMMNHVPQVLEDVAIDAKSKTEPCPRCDASGLEPNTDETPCKLCRGQGEVRVKGDDTARQLLFEAQGLKGKKAPTVAIQQNFGGGVSLEETLSMTQKLLVP